MTSTLHIVVCEALRQDKCVTALRRQLILHPKRKTSTASHNLEPRPVRLSPCIGEAAVGRLSKRLKKLKPLAAMALPFIAPWAAPLIALAQTRRPPTSADQEGFTPTINGGWLPREVNNFDWGGAVRGGMAGAGGGSVFGPVGTAIGGIGGVVAGGYEEGDLDFGDEEETTMEEDYDDYEDDEYY